MRFPPVLCLAALALGAAARAGSIVGTVTARGPAGAEAAAGGGAYESHRYRLAERVDYDHLADFVVYVDQAVNDPALPPPAEVTVTQRNVSFEPHVLPIVVGTTVRWPNKDTIFHNVFSMSDAKPFDLGMYTKDKEKVPELKFDQLGRVDVYCSIHSQMHCIILVLPSAFFARSDAHNHYAIRGLPAGTYWVKAWQERMPARRIAVRVPAAGEVRQDFTLGLNDLPKY
ncbi:MAG TPA: carboxypeptidase regulatory-like domain-containing protein [Opitutaceae bacterium]|nr:carboxypeptidase regulatory-like domain-containing protein [Opitutaceae bacterium]